MSARRDHDSGVKHRENVITGISTSCLRSPVHRTTPRERTEGWDSQPQALYGDGAEDAMSIMTTIHQRISSCCLVEAFSLLIGQTFTADTQLSTRSFNASLGMNDASANLYSSLSNIRAS
ncbi:hypothetical protein J8273_4671 [Carpediemonas membranifera]|uniref:Uncharacterized protein n=1 Tax=Carpediemonas membranifera TaxID=201153 RepID=A0A8J6ATM2_9EUKA|nr:hypothetical protein J8273_4671 [Carpediemonas membranifera]|eukprot:KAG9393808.1 hypothetical protein J8273_4671 [Carpediemonas membranifera]